MADVKTSWTWDRSEICEIRDREIWVATMDPCGGNGTSCSLQQFLDGTLTWLLPDDVRREVLASVQKILRDRRPLKDEVLRGDEVAIKKRLDPAFRRAYEEQERAEAEAERVRQAEKARLEKRVTEEELPDRQCFVCLHLLAQYANGRQIFEKKLIGFPHSLHGPALEAVDAGLAAFGPTVDRMPLHQCQICRELPERSVATFARPFDSRAEKVIDLVAAMPFDAAPLLTVRSRDEYRQCPGCGRLYRLWEPDYEWNENPAGDDVSACLERTDLESLRRALRYRIAEGDLPEWVASRLSG